MFINNTGDIEDYHFSLEQLFNKPKAAMADQFLCDEPKQEDYEEDERTPHRIGNRLSFDFCELRADQLLESTPLSFHEGRLKGNIFEYPKNRLKNKQAE